MKDFFNYVLIFFNIVVLFITFNSSKNDNYIDVEIKGMVKKPGLYNVLNNSNVNDVISLAGGLKEDADISVINLARKVHDEDIIIIYSNDEINEMKKGSTSVKFVEKECICPRIDNVALFSNAITNIDDLIIKTGKISLNSATIEELITLPGIGTSKAKLIIEYREKNNGFKSIEEITNVKGIGSANFEKIKNYLTL